MEHKSDPEVKKLIEKLTGAVDILSKRLALAMKENQKLRSKVIALESRLGRVETNVTNISSRSK